MEKLQRYIKALIAAYDQGKLFVGSYCNCAVATLLKEVGCTPHWGSALENYIYGVPLVEGAEHIEFYAELLGYSVEELIEIEAAFEGTPIIVGERRVSMGNDEEIIDRLTRTIQKLEEIEARKVEDEVELEMA